LKGIDRRPMEGAWAKGEERFAIWKQGAKKETFATGRSRKSWFLGNGRVDQEREGVQKGKKTGGVSVQGKKKNLRLEKREKLQPLSALGGEVAKEGCSRGEK